jgi:sugar O-acyltransferase (sialic acid O-acetyltransferase NeuD family)
LEKLLNKSVIILGGGGHASVLIEILRLIDSDIIGIVDPFLEKGIKVKDITVIGSDDAVLDYPNSGVVLVNALGPLPKKSTREDLSTKFINLGYQFLTLIHPRAYVSPSARIEDGAQIMAGALVQAKSYIGRLSVINSGAIIEHDCCIGDHAHIAPGAILCGGVQAGSGVFVGGGAIVLENLRLEAYSTLAAGVTLRRNLLRKEVFYGH